jgi:2-haloacid dehalogenase
VIPGLQALQARGIRLAFLSNLTPAMLNGCIQSSGLTGMFEQVLSTEAVKTFKPDARAYQLGADNLKLPASQILFVAFAGWDAAGAKTFGYPTYWVNRLGLPAEELGTLPDATGASLTDLPAFVDSA